MRARRNLYKSISLPTGEILTPVSVGDLPASTYSVQLETITEDVTTNLEANRNLAGVILKDQDQLAGMIPRKRIFERLGHRYGVELFLRKPISELYKNLNLKLDLIPGRLSIKDAVHFALSRPAQEIYEPIVIVDDNQNNPRLLEVHTLLMAQTRSMDHLNNLIGNLNQIRLALADGSLGMEKTLELILGGLKQVVPHHQASILLAESSGSFSTWRPGAQPAFEVIEDTAVFHFIMSMSQPVYVEDVRQFPSWKSVQSLAEMRTWLGLPLKQGNDRLGILSLARRLISPFSKNEMDIAQAYADCIGIAIGNYARRSPAKSSSRDSSRFSS